MRQLSDYIKKLNIIMPPTLCDAIMAEYKASEEWTPAKIEDGHYPEVRSCSQLDMSHTTSISKNAETRTKLDAAVFEFVGRALAEYKLLFPRVSVSTDTGYLLLRYNKGDFVRQHVDVSGSRPDPRVLTCSIQLSGGDEFTGGGWGFFDEDTYTVKQNKGEVVIFPSNFCFPHQLFPIETGVRYSILTWLR